MLRFLDLAKINARHDLQTAAARVVDSGWYVLGREVELFENTFAAFCGRRFCIGTASGLDALTLILRAAIHCGRLHPGAEVLVPANTYIASVLAVLHAGLIPRLVEPEEESFNLSAKAAAANITPDTGALLPVHLYGRADDMAALAELCNERNLFLLSDAAQAHGALNGGTPAVAFGDAAGFSFYPGKNLGALGDGGCVVTDDEQLADCLRVMRNYGSSRKYENTIVGINSRLDELQAALLSAKFPLLEEDNIRRRALAAAYAGQIKNPQVILPAMPEDAASHVWHLFVVRCHHRAELQKHLKENGVETLIHYPIPPHRQEALKELPLAAMNFPRTEQMADEVLSLPLSPVLSDEEAALVVAAVNSFT